MVEEDAAEDLEIDTQAEVAKPLEKKAIEPSEDESVTRLSGRFSALVKTTSERLARRIGRSDHLAEKDILLISQALAVPLDQVQLWASQIDEPLDQKKLTESLISLGQNL